jgi:hypothetical protein
MPISSDSLGNPITAQHTKSYTGLAWSGCVELEYSLSAIRQQQVHSVSLQSAHRSRMAYTDECLDDVRKRVLHSAHHPVALECQNLRLNRKQIGRGKCIDDTRCRCLLLLLALATTCCYCTATATSTTCWPMSLCCSCSTKRNTTSITATALYGRMILRSNR